MQSGLTLLQYAEEKRLPPEFLETLGVHDRKYQGKPALAMPYKDRQGDEFARRYRISLEGEKFRWRSGDKASAGLYGLWRLSGGEDVIVLVEGESDSQTLWFHDIAALGVPGASNWNDQHADALEHVERIYVVQEPDQGGETLVEALTGSRLIDRIHVVTVPAGDVSGLYLSNPEAFLVRWKQAVAEARPLTEIIAEEAEQTRAEAWEQCKELAATPNILDRVRDDLNLLGVVGEDRAAQLIYLVVTSRLLARPVSAGVKGVSASGKSFTTNQALRFFPQTAFYELSAMSERALAYSKEPLKHRVLVLYEAHGLQGDFGSYLLRSLLSEGKVRYETVQKTNDGLESILIEREGPTGLLLTTTAIRLHPENETRMLSILVNDSREQTAMVMQATAEEGSYEELLPDLKPWIAFQEWLAAGPSEVDIPFAQVLASAIPPVAVRLRRDFPLLLSLIRTHALLHQVNRDRDSKARIVATIDDYLVVRGLVGDLIAEGVESAVSPTVRETVRAVEKLRLRVGKSSHTGAKVTYSAVSQELDLDKSSGYRRAQAAIKAGYLQNLEDQKGRPANLDLGDPLPEDVTVLPDREALVAGLQPVLEGKSTDSFFGGDL